ncbi:nickel-dependent lactate racemase [Veillonella sp. R32]|uniref:nickel-dependent lactate racemase n=1 Tax=Veillonella sp. R32 TaxID=2021312 RepID=UPI0013897B28|nr:nickel-dependent lactate racemase [Veillonella sp. R32]KAF1681684.1 transcriptional regulator [Veillonella sp. R32]
MRTYSFHYGEQMIDCTLDETRVIGELHMAEIPVIANPEKAIREALANPIDSKPLKELVKPGETVAIIANDTTRIANTHVFMPIILDTLNEAGIPDENIKIVFALGTHRDMTEAEMISEVGLEAAGRVTMINSSAKKADQFTYVGTTSFGTDVYLNRHVVEADHIICTGSVVHHFFAGFGGGRKAILPGVASYETIRQNHSLMLDDKATIGHLEGNPIYDDQMEGVAMCPPTFLLNVVLNGEKEFTGVFAGHYITAHKAACDFVNAQNGVVIERQAPIVIASTGGYPKDINIYHSQKTMDNAVRAVQPGGVVILLAECREGSGSAIFDETVNTFDSIQAIEDSVRKDFQIGRHKAYAVTRLMKKVDFYLLSSLEDEYARKAFFTPVASLEDALRLAEAKLGADAEILLMPHGSYTVPILKEVTK